MLEKFLKKIGVNSFSELNEEEKQTYREWEISLSGRNLTEKDVQDWLQDELNTATLRLTEINLSKEDEIFRKMEVRFIRKVVGFLNSPQVEKEFATKAIEQLINK